MHPAIAIDGPAASGKSTVAKLIADRLGYTFINTGAMYRAVTWYMRTRRTCWNPCRPCPSLSARTAANP